MSFTVLREATEEDVARLNGAAQSFLKRHHFEPTPFLLAGSLPLEAYNAALDHDAEYHGHNRMREAWKKVAQRALRDPRADTIAYGYVGYSVK